MKNGKRIVCLLMACCLLIAVFAACGTTKELPQASASAESSTETAQAELPEPEDTQPAAEPKGSQLEGPAAADEADGGLYAQLSVCTGHQ